MTEAKALETTVKSFLFGVSVGTVLAMVLKPHDHSHNVHRAHPVKEPPRDIVDVASEESFPASDAPAY